MDKTEKLLKELTDADGIPGYETEVRNVMRRYFEPLGEIDQDKTGSLICKQTGSTTEPKIMLAGHMDEIGFMVQRITKEGFYYSEVVALKTPTVVENHMLPSESTSMLLGSRPPRILTIFDISISLSIR